ncbi:TIGR01457 family HAD-type hydrolase [Sporosarcina sp. JAI121]|uniref:TIGR01457 family HAD-type hydrolase n=1 Tax=Sporosarcina sp. JAI121 TaxID=2723064 RepID=UPI0015C80BEB|nr:TIGR01457 family HAD-type hydrolase [Sporosarcina sp. JAI121]NYF26185.1 4-nitrophenyl phosphatase [Sporosarcina sp. JAI121]
MIKEKYNAICLDLDGTVYRGIEPIPEAVTFIGNMQHRGIDPYFITNNSSMTRLQLQEKLASFGIKADSDRIMTSAIAAAKYCKGNHDGASVMMIGEKGLEEALAFEGIEVVKENPDVIIMGIDRGVTYAKLADACLAIRAGAHFIATNSDKAFPTERGLVPGNGSFAKLMENATGVSPVYVGKPEPHMLGFIQQENGYCKEEMVMIGDNYDTDILAGIRFGIDTVHVAGGVTSLEEIRAKQHRPTHSLRTLLELGI